MADPSSYLLFILGYSALGLKIYALLDACIRPGAAFPAAGKLTKLIWVAILAAAVILGRTELLGLLGIAGLIAAAVYLVDVRPAVKELRGGDSGDSGRWR